MSYNGVGVPTPRGTGGSGYVTMSLAPLKNIPKQLPPSAQKVPKFSEALKENERLRKIENECLVLRRKLEKEGRSEEIIESRIIDLRKQLNENQKEDKKTYFKEEKTKIAEK